MTLPAPGVPDKESREELEVSENTLEVGQRVTPGGLKQRTGLRVGFEA